MIIGMDYGNMIIVDDVVYYLDIINYEVICLLNECIFRKYIY